MICLRSLPLEDRLRLFQKSISLYEKGIRPHKIAKILNLSPRIVCLWVRGERKPGNEYLPKTKVDATKKKEIAYLAGVIHSDGSMVICKKRCIIMLKATDEDFIHAFKNALKVVTGKNPKISNEKFRSHFYNGRLIRNTKLCLSVSIASKQLYKVLNNPEEYINSNPQDYIKGFADGDGSIFLCRKGSYTYYRINLYNKDKSKLEKIRTLLIRLGIDAYIRPHTTSSSNIYALCIHRVASVEKFMENIGFSIQRKMQKWELNERGAENHGEKKR